ncbi:hypothetical protein [Streptomyces antimycoticus]
MNESEAAGESGGVGIDGVIEKALVIDPHVPLGGQRYDAEAVAPQSGAQDRSAGVASFLGGVGGQVDLYELAVTSQQERGRRGRHGWGSP